MQQQRKQSNPVIAFTWMTAAAALTLLILGGCASSGLNSDSLTERLANRGITVLSANNPFLAPNLYLKKAEEGHPELEGFFERVGYPLAIEVEKEFMTPAVTSLYYPEHREIYWMEPTEDLWVIHGPYKMPPDVLARLKKEMRAGARAPEKITAGFDGAPEITSDLDAPAAPQRKQAEPLELQRQLQIEELVLAHSSAPAERTPRGDLIHYVTEPNETLLDIALWYTFEEENALRIERTNRIENPAKLEVGESIVVPEYLVKNGKVLTQEGLSALRGIRADAGGPAPPEPLF